MGTLRRYSTLIALTLSFAGSSGFVACGSSDNGRAGGGNTGGTDSGTGGAGGSSAGAGGGGAGGSSAGAGGGGAAGAGGGTIDAAPDNVTSNGDATADGPG